MSGKFVAGIILSIVGMIGGIALIADRGNVHVGSATGAYCGNSNVGFPLLMMFLVGAILGLVLLTWAYKSKK